MLSDNLQATGAGVLEGYLTADRIIQAHANDMYMVFNAFPSPPPAAFAFLQEQYWWLWNQTEMFPNEYDLFSLRVSRL